MLKVEVGRVDCLALTREAWMVQKTRPRAPQPPHYPPSYHSVQELDAALQLRPGVAEEPEEEASHRLALTQGAVVLLCGPSRRWRTSECRTRWTKKKDQLEGGHGTRRTSPEPKP